MSIFEEYGAFNLKGFRFVARLYEKKLCIACSNKKS